MKKLLFFTTFIIIFSFVFPTFSFSQGMMGLQSSSPDNTSIQSQQQEEQTGKKLLDGLSNKTVICSQLKDADLEKIGEYFMGQSIGDTSRHIAMNEMMKRMMGEQGEEQMHIVMGKRLSGCDTGASVTSQGTGFMTMMGSAFAQGFGGTKGGGNSMMGYGWGGFGFGWIFMVLFWGLIILGVVALFRYLGVSGNTTKNDKNPLDILKERYAKGEVDKKEFEEMKKDLK